MSTTPDAATLRAVADLLDAAIAEPVEPWKTVVQRRGPLIEKGFNLLGTFPDLPEWWRIFASLQSHNEQDASFQFFGASVSLYLRTLALAQDWQARRATLQAALEATPDGLERFQARQDLKCVADLEDEEAGDLLRQAMEGA